MFKTRFQQDSSVVSPDENEAVSDDLMDNPAEAEMDHVTGDAGDAKDKDEDCKYHLQPVISLS